jgi:branched-chain amino acid transport system ATP-binding protein
VTGPPLLVARDVTKRFGGLLAVDRVGMTVHAGEIVGLIGPNGAGKTTLFNCLTGVIVPTSGTVSFRGRPLAGTPDRITKAGVARTFQSIRLFADMTVLENVLVGRHLHTPEGLLAAIGHGVRFRRAEQAARACALEMLAFVGLRDKHAELARNLAYGDQRRLEIARALATEPGLLLLDEPTAGMNPQETAATVDLVRRVRDGGRAVVVIEHDMRFIFGVCDRVTVLVQGGVLVTGSPRQVQADPRVIEAYLGSGDLPGGVAAAPSAGGGR